MQHRAGPATHRDVAADRSNARQILGGGLRHSKSPFLAHLGLGHRREASHQACEDNGNNTSKAETKRHTQEAGGHVHE
jgi:hypothetical protein